MKHEIPGLEVEGDCWRGGRPHLNTFGGAYPCMMMQDVTREALTACLPDTSPACVQYLPPLDPAVSRCGLRTENKRKHATSQ